MRPPGDRCMHRSRGRHMCRPPLRQRRRRSSRDPVYPFRMPSQGIDAQIGPDELVAALIAALDAAPPAKGAAAYERVVASLLFALGQSETPADLGPALVDAIAARGDEQAAAVLAALAVLAGDPLAARADEAVRALAASGLRSPIAAGVGRLAPTEAVMIDNGEAELLVALLAMPGR